MPSRVGSALVLVVVVGCGGGSSKPDAPPPPNDASAIDAPQDASAIDAPIDASIDAPPDGPAWACATPVADGCGSTEVCGNGADDNCDGSVDEGCPCEDGTVQSCFAGKPGRRGVGGCLDGTQVCVEGAWTGCGGGIPQATAEFCDTVDNDCNGCVDDLAGCEIAPLACPTRMPDGTPFTPYVIDGTTLFPGSVESWRWQVSSDNPCDELLLNTAGKSTYTLTGQTTSQLTITPTLSGDFTVTLTIVTTNGETYTCTFVVHVAGSGLRVEMCSDKTGQTDLDLHLHRPNSTLSWFSTANGATCYYENCKAQPFSGVSAVNWGYANSPLTACAGGPEGASWTTLGYCRNPRLDIDSIRDEGVPENINVDVPEAAAYRVMVNYFGGDDLGVSVTVHPMVNVYCGGRLRGVYGRAPELVSGFTQAGGSTSGAMWRVADVTPVVSDGETTDCALAPLHPPGTSSGYWVTRGDSSY